MMKNFLTISIFCFVLTMTLPSCKTAEPITAEQWHEIELTFSSGKEYSNPYTDVEFWVEFTGPSGEKLIRPGFWDGSNSFKVSFANPLDKGEWQWTSFASNMADAGLHGKSGKLVSAPYSGNNPLVMNGLLRMSPGKCNVVHANGKSFLMIGDTPWALLWRGTVESVTEYAQKRQSQGFNTALLMSLQPDRDAVGPRNRTEVGAFDVAFPDLKDGHINQLNTGYFQYFDTLRNILIDHGIVPVYQPVFHGFRWKGQNVLGWNVDEKEYARYCRYLVARFGAKPAMWLVTGDSDSRDKGIVQGGEEIEKWDAYEQPTGQHYSPYCTLVPDWWNRSYEYIPHQNKVNQDKGWLDFQWCQTGHGGEHLFPKVEKMYANILFKDEPGWPDWANSNVSWKEALQLPGANYVGYLGKALEGLDIADIEMHPELTGRKPCLAKPGELYLVYLPEGGEVTIADLPENLTFRWFNPVKGEFYTEGKTVANQLFSSEMGQPSVLIVSKP